MQAFSNISCFDKVKKVKKRKLFQLLRKKITYEQTYLQNFWSPSLSQKIWLGLIINIWTNTPLHAYKK